MTNKEAVLALCAVSVNEATADFELISNDLDPNWNYSIDTKDLIAKIACEVLSSTLSLSSIKEGDLTISFDREGIKTRLYFLSKKFGFSEFQPEGPSVSSPKVW